jgi:hypothetical protein
MYERDFEELGTMMNESRSSKQSSSQWNSESSLAISLSNNMKESQDYLKFNAENITRDDLIYFRVIAVT